MSFELTVSAQRDPLGGRHSGSRENTPCPAHTAVALNGSFDEAASRAVLQTVAELAVGEARSIVVEMQDVELSDTLCLHAFAGGLMAQRSAGVHVQVATRHERLRATLEKLPDARDWLLDTKTDTDGARVALHLDGVIGTD